MAERLVVLRFFASTLLLCNAAVASTPPTGALGIVMKQEDARRPEVVVAWLRANAAKADRRMANSLFEMGLRTNKQKNWSASTKDFGESMIRFPGPRALAEYARARHRMLGSVRARERASNDVVAKDMRHFLDVYETSLAADDVVQELEPHDKEQILSDVTCVKAHLQTGRAQPECRPLQYFAQSR